jgi:hypothetical protein
MVDLAHATDFKDLEVHICFLVAHINSEVVRNLVLLGSILPMDLVVHVRSLASILVSAGAFAIHSQEFGVIDLVVHHVGDLADSNE